MNLNNPIVALVLIALLSLGSAAAQAVEVEQPWVRATPPGAKLSAGFMRLRSDDGGADRLIAVSSPSAGRIEIHESRMDGEVMRMRELPDGVEVPADGQVLLAPGGIHLMLLDLPAPLSVGEQIRLQLQFERAGSITVDAPVRPPGADAGEHDHHH